MVPSGSTELLSTIQGFSMGAISYQSYFDTSNVAFGMGTLIGEFSALSNFFDESVISTVNVGVLPYSRYLVANVTHFGSSFIEVSGFSANTALPVPEPASIALMAIGLVGLGLVGRRRKSGPARTV